MCRQVRPSNCHMSFKVTRKQTAGFLEVVVKLNFTWKTLSPQNKTEAKLWVWGNAVWGNAGGCAGLFCLYILQFHHVVFQIYVAGEKRRHPIMWSPLCQWEITAMIKKKPSPTLYSDWTCFGLHPAMYTRKIVPCSITNHTFVCFSCLLTDTASHTFELTGACCICTNMHAQTGTVTHGG